jgi:hypothetical protein
LTSMGFRKDSKLLLSLFCGTEAWTNYLPPTPSRSNIGLKQGISFLPPPPAPNFLVKVQDSDIHRLGS